MATSEARSEQKVYFIRITQLQIQHTTLQILQNSELFSPAAHETDGQLPPIDDHRVRVVRSLLHLLPEPVQLLAPHDPRVAEPPPVGGYPPGRGGVLHIPGTVLHHELCLIVVWCVVVVVVVFVVVVAVGCRVN